MNYLMADSAHDLKLRLLGKRIDKRIRWFELGIVCGIVVCAITVRVWA